MQCHECADDGEHKLAVGLCRFCLVGLCKSHLVALYRHPSTVPQYACNHRVRDEYSAHRVEVTT